MTRLSDVHRPGFGARLVALLVDYALISNALPVAYVLTVAFQKDRRGPHDLVAGTKVIALR
ncbi:MAG: hypothetical protein Q4G21_03505 [Dermabacter sp.]|nr:hypothetical protein [Dermabacter sp.]